MVWFLITFIFSSLLEFIGIGRLSEREKDLEILILRHQLDILEHKQKKRINPNQVEKMTLMDEINAEFQYLIRNHDSKYTHAFNSVIASNGMHVIPTPLKAPNANAYAERFLSNLREQCLDNLLIINETHLRTVLKEYLAYYNERHPHQGLDQQSPIPRPSCQAEGKIIRCKVLGGIINDFHRRPITALA